MQQQEPSKASRKELHVRVIALLTSHKKCQGATHCGLACALVRPSFLATAATVGLSTTLGFAVRVQKLWYVMLFCMHSMKMQR